jgi:hypothetical protein
MNDISFVAADFPLFFLFSSITCALILLMSCRAENRLCDAIAPTLETCIKGWSQQPLSVDFNFLF